MRRVLAGLAATAAALACAPVAGATFVGWSGPPGAQVLLVREGGSGGVVAEVNRIGILYRFDANLGDHQIGVADSAAPLDYDSSDCLLDGDTVYCRFPAGGLRVEAGAMNDEVSAFVSTSDPGGQGIPMTFLGGDGNDKLRDETRNTVTRTLDGGPGNDELFGAGGTSGSTDDDGSEIMLGGDGDDDLKNGGGADELHGGNGNDKLTGDGFQAPSADVMDGGPGVDSIDEWTQPANSTHPPATLIQDGVANDGRAGEGDNVVGIEAVVAHVSGTYEGTPGADNFAIWANLDQGASTLRGLDGNDRLVGLASRETMDGGNGDDYINGGYNNDTLTGGPGRDTIYGDSTDDLCSIYACQNPFGDDTINSRDGEADAVDCGIGNDSVQADQFDTVASSCESVSRADVAPPPASGQPGAPGQAGAGGGGAAGGGAGAAVIAIIGKATINSVASKGLAFSVTCPGACRIAAKLVVDSAAARKIRSSTGRLGGAKSSLLAAGSTQLKIKVSRKLRRRFARLRKATATLTVVTTDAAGRATTTKKRISLRRR